MNIPVEKYLKYTLVLKEKEKTLIREFKDWLPEKIIDCHIHANTRKQVVFISDELRKKALTTFPWFRISDHLMVKNIFYPAKKVRFVVFPFPYVGINHRKANQYLLTESQKHNKTIMPVLCGIPNDLEYTTTSLRSGNFCGLKMYPVYKYPPVRKISKYFPDEVLLFWNSCNGTIILHLPFNIVECLNELTGIARKFPNLKIILAHMGLAYLPIKELPKAYKELSQFKNVFLDTAFVTSEEVFKIGLEIFGHTRILFGTDQPLSLIRGRICCHPKLGLRIATDYPYHWANSKEQKRYSQDAKDTIHIHWEILLSLRSAIKRYDETEEVKSHIFCKNAERLFQFKSSSEVL